jgi:isopentenyl-diphosphate delta-isomerase
MKSIIHTRKNEHIEICINKDIEDKENFFSHVNLVHNALPEINFDEIDTSVKFLGKKLSLPFMISALTGGTDEGKKINKQLAEIAEKFNIGFGLGSQRIMLEYPETKDTFYVRDVAPTTLVIGNIGVTELKKRTPDEIISLVEDVECDGIAVHLNPAQEVFQLNKEGDVNWQGCYDVLQQLCKKSRYPVIAKEVGCGISKEVAMKLKDIGISAIDIGGKGGTNWIKIESIRSKKDMTPFVDWGIPTPISILEVKQSGIPIIATGGIRNGVDIAKSIILGANIAGIALPFLKILKQQGLEGVENYIRKLEFELKVTMFLTGSKNIEELKKVKYVLSQDILNWFRQREFDTAVLL